MKRKYEIAVLSKGAFARTVRIYSPKGADRAIIMHDGQNVFSDSDAAYKKSWRAIDVLKSAGIKNTAIIGIDCTATRYNDYLPYVTDFADYGIRNFGGNADVYMDYLEQIVIPYLDKRFGYKFYALLGSSAGGIATLYFATRKNKRIKAYGIYSAPLFINSAAYDKMLSSATFDTDSFYHVYVGGNENTGTFNDCQSKIDEPQLFADSAFTLVNGLRKSGISNLIFDYVGNGVHDETAWRNPEKNFMLGFSAIRP